MKILVLSNMYPSNSHLFYGVFVKNFSNSMQMQGAKIHKVVICGRGVGVLNKILKYTKYFASSFYQILLCDYDLIYVHSANLALLPVSMLRWLIKKPIVINIHGGDILDRSFVSDAILKFNSKTIVKSNLIVIPSNHFRRDVSEIFDISNTKTYVSPSGGVDMDIFKPQKKCIAQDRVSHIGYISRIDKDKGWDTFLAAIDNLRKSDNPAEIFATIVGTGSEVHKMHNMIKERGLHSIYHIEQLPQTQLPSIYSKFDLFVFPSRRSSESLGLVGLEAMSCGVPVVASRIGGIQDYVEHGVNGFLFEPGDDQELSKIISKYFSLGQDERSRLSINALHTAERYDSKHVAKELFDQLASLKGNDVA